MKCEIKIHTWNNGNNKTVIFLALIAVNSLPLGSCSVTHYKGRLITLLLPLTS